MATAAVRPAAAPDVDEIVRIQADTWASAYAELVPGSAVEQLRSPAARRAWQEAVAAGEGFHVLVATEGPWTVGFCAAARSSTADGTGPAPVPDDIPDDIPATDAGTGGGGGPVVGPERWAEIGALLVEPRWGRRGHGGRLLATAAAALRDAGALFGLAWVPEADEASRRFYARAGWEPDGTVRVLDTGEGSLREVRITGSLDLALEP